MSNKGTKLFCLILIVMLLVSTNAIAASVTQKTSARIEDVQDENRIISYDSEDLDELVDLEVTVTIKEIRALDKIDLVGEADFYVKVFVNGEFWWKTPVWYNCNYVEDSISKTINVPDDEENVSIKIQLWDWNLGKDKLCDISTIYDQDLIDKRDIDLVYSLKSGHWRGDDFNTPDVLFDPSGYGRANGCDDNTYNRRDLDCELWFDITQNDYDGDGIPYWTEVNVFGTDPEVDDTGLDDDEDGVPIEWEYKWGHYFQRDYSHWPNVSYYDVWFYDPFVYEDHENMDPDQDGLQNTEEYLTSQWGSDPFRQDIFLELDQMEIGPNGEGGQVPDRSKQLLRDAFSRHNIVFLVDDGCMGGGTTSIPYEVNTSDEELEELYLEYFMNNDSNNWRRGVFHYCLVVYHADTYTGFARGYTVGNIYQTDSFVLSSDLHEIMFKYPLWNIIRRRSLDREYHREIVYASVMMHETGHVLGVYRGNTPGSDSDEDLKYLNYRSCMNYFYVYYLIDYSDGSHGKNDFDDWGRIDLTRFEIQYLV